MVLNYEVGLSALLCLLGFELNSLANSQIFYPHDNPPVLATKALVSRLGFFLKTSVLRQSQSFSLRKTRRLFRSVECDKTLILNHLVRTAGDELVVAKLPNFSIQFDGARLFWRYAPQQKFRVLLVLATAAANSFLSRLKSQSFCGLTPKASPKTLAKLASLSNQNLFLAFFHSIFYARLWRLYLKLYFAKIKFGFYKRSTCKSTKLVLRI